MSTHASLTVVTAGGNYATVYVHADGYLDYTGRLLLSHYNTQKQAEELIQHGDMSCLRDSTDEIYYYGRNGGEAGTGAQVYSSHIEALLGNRQQYNYLWDGEQWLVGREKTKAADFKPLADQLATR